MTKPHATSDEDTTATVKPTCEVYLLKNVVSGDDETPEALTHPVLAMYQQYDCSLLTASVACVTFHSRCRTFAFR